MDPCATGFHLLGSVLYSLPFAVGPYISAIEGIPHRYTEAARALGLSRWQTLWYITFPLSRAGVITGTLMAFAYTIGEFGVVLLVGGNIPRETHTAPVYLFDLVQALEYRKAHLLALGMLLFSVLVLGIIQWVAVVQRYQRR